MRTCSTSQSDKMLEQRAKVIGPQWLRPRFGGADRLRKMIQKKQEPQVTAVHASSVAVPYLSLDRFLL